MAFLPPIYQDHVATALQAAHDRGALPHAAELTHDRPRLHGDLRRSTGAPG